MREFVGRHKLTFPNVYDEKGKIATAYGFSYQPFWALIDRRGQLVHAGFGPTSDEELRRRLMGLVR